MLKLKWLVHLWIKLSTNLNSSFILYFSYTGAKSPPHACATLLITLAISTSEAFALTTTSRLDGPRKEQIINQSSILPYSLRTCPFQATRKGPVKTPKLCCGTVYSPIRLQYIFLRRATSGSTQTTRTNYGWRV